MRSLLFLAGSLPLAALPSLGAAQPVLLDPVVLSANRAPSDAARTGSSVSVLTAPELEADGRPFVLDQLAGLPGVTVQQNGPPGTVSGFAIRGLPQEYVRVEVEGIEISDPSGPQVAPSLSGVLVDDIGRVEVLRGSQSALYGGQAVAGVISITTPRPTAPGIENRLILEGGSFSTFRGGYSLAGLGQRGEFALTAARFQTDGFSAAEEADGNTEDDGYTTTRLSGSGRLYLSDSTDLFASGFYQDEAGDFDAGPGPFSDAPNTFDQRSWGLRAGVEHTGESGLTSTLAASWFDLDRKSVQFFPGFGASTNRPEGTRARAEYLGSLTAAPGLDVRFGADYARETSQSTFDPERSNWIAGGFVQSNWALSDAVQLDAAARYDEHSQFGGYPTGRLTLAWLPAPDTTLRGSLGTGFRAPSNYELYARFIPDVPGPGDADLDPETSVSADIGVAHRFAGGRGQASATLFWIEIDDLIQYDPGDFLTGEPARYFQDDGTARSRGAELAGGWEFSEALALTAAYTYTDAEVADGERRNRIPRHAAALALTGVVAERVSYDLNARFVWDFYDASTTVESAAFTRDYVVVNARLAYAVTDAAEVYVRAANLFDEAYQTARGYSTADRAFYAGVAARF